MRRLPADDGEVEVGDDVVVNVQARALGLGSGGFDVLYANLTRGLDLPRRRRRARDVAAVRAAASARSGTSRRTASSPTTSRGLPVVCCTVHSQVAPVCAALRGLRVAYVQVGGGALPVALSDALRSLRAAGLVETTVAVAPCFDGDVQAVTAASALAWAAARRLRRRRLLGRPGDRRHGSRLGHGASRSPRRRTPRWRSAAARSSPSACRSGTSGHATAASRTTAAPVARALPRTAAVAWPAGLDPPDVARGAREEVDAAAGATRAAALPLSFMGRGADDEPSFFAAAHAAGIVAATTAADAPRRRAQRLRKKRHTFVRVA